MELKAHYEKLYIAQDEILALLAKSQCGLYLGGGTALNRFILNSYRYSDDIDLFSIDTSLKSANELNKFMQILCEHVDLQIVVNSHSFKRLYLPKSKLKIDLIHDRVKHIGDFHEKNGFLVDNVRNIFINKLDASYSRDELRDFFDLYIILKNYKFDLLSSCEDLQEKSNNSLEDICSNIRAFCQIDLNNIINKVSLPIVDEDIRKDFMQNGQKFLYEYFSVFRQDDLQIKLQTRKPRR